MNGVETLDERDDNEPQENPPPDIIPISHKLKWLPKLSVAGAAMKGVAHVTNLERTLWEMRETHEQHNDLAHILDDRIMDVSDMEVNDVLGIAEDDLQNYKEPKKAYDPNNWEKSYDDEIESMHHHNVCVRYWIVNGSLTKSNPLCCFSATPPPFQLHSISVPPPTLLHSSLFPPCFILHPCLPVSLISVPMLPWSSHLSHIVSYPIPSSPCFMLVPLFLVPDWVKLNLQHRVS